MVKSKKKVLIIEDDELLLELFERAIKKTGCQVKVARDGQEGLKIINANKIDIVFLD